MSDRINGASLSSPSAPFAPRSEQDGLDTLRAKLHDAESRMHIGAMFLLTMAQGFRDGRQPSKAAACEAMADILEEG